MRPVPLRIPPRELPLNFFPSRRHAHAALRRMLARARRQSLPMTLVRLELPPAADPGARQELLRRIGDELRITDLAWWDDAAAAFLFLLESTGDVAPLLARWRTLAAERQLAARAVPAHFPRQGTTLGALLEGLA